MKEEIYLDDFGVVCSLGNGKKALWGGVIAVSEEGIRPVNIAGRPLYIGLVSPDLYSEKPSPPFNNRVSAILRLALDEIKSSAEAVIAKYGAKRVAVLIGSCDNGSEASLNSYEYFLENGVFPDDYTLAYQRADLPAKFASDYLGTEGPVIAYSTACASSASAIVSARNLIMSGLCDAAIAGGVDIVSDAVALGFSALEAVSEKPCKPFSVNRNGISLGEGAAVYVITKEIIRGEGIKLLGAGESGDAYHMTAPNPEGTGAAQAMSRALDNAELTPEDVDYINLHGTGTPLNDAMESRAVAQVFSREVPVSSTKSLTAHTLGAAGALGLGVCWLALSGYNNEKTIPPQIWDGQQDPDCPSLDIITKGRQADRLQVCMNNTFAFGGCNVSLVIGK
ncbi:MAG: 3-oxoacyl-ACP synthase [Spirochaetales bacterium]|nr:3-oxoacyl-ACP synthase [Spirochaetales bacterium]